MDTSNKDIYSFSSLMILRTSSPTSQQVKLWEQLYVLNLGMPVITFSKPWPVTKKNECK